MMVLQVLAYVFGGAVIVSIVGLLLWMLFQGFRNCYGLYCRSIGTMKFGIGKIFLTLGFIIAVLVGLCFVRW